ncbi:MAG TPA: NUDIX hydrolase [Bacteroidota bacterium]
MALHDNFPSPPGPALRQLSQEVLYRGKVFDLIVDHIQYPSGNHGVREVARHPGGAVTVPLFPDRSILLVRQFRYPLQGYTLELPAGKLNAGEDPAEAAVRELEEETGWIAGHLEKLTAIYTTPGFCTEILHIFLATELRQSPRGHHREEGELGMSVHLLPLEEALGMAERGELNDSKTLVGLFLAERRLRQH